VLKLLFLNFGIPVVKGRELELVMLAKLAERPPVPVRLGIGVALVLLRLPVAEFCPVSCCSEVAAADEPGLELGAVSFFPVPVAKGFSASALGVVPGAEADFASASLLLFDVPKESTIPELEIEELEDEWVVDVALVLFEFFDPSEVLRPAEDESVAFRLTTCVPCASVLFPAACVVTVSSP
jgi:hypothetical protein